MDWLKDPKNQPKAAAILAGVIVVVGVLMYFLYFRQPSADTAAAPPPAEQTAGAPPPGGTPGTDLGGGVDSGLQPAGAPAGGPQPGGPPMGGPQPGAPAPGGAPGTAPAAQPQQVAQAGSAKPMEAWRPDPFLPLDYKPPKSGPKPKPRIADFPFINLGGMAPPPPPPPADTPQPPRRMAGVLVGSKIYAIIETNGESEIVQPGDTLKDRLAVVERIERDRVVLKTKDPRPKYIVVRMAAAPNQPSGSPGSPTSPRSTGPRSTGPYPGPPGGRFRSGPEADFD